MRPIQADVAAILDKFGGSGILFSELLAADQGETALLTFSDTVTELVDFTSDADDLTHELKRLHPDGGGAAVMDGLMAALDKLSHRPPGRRLIVLMTSESRDRSSQAKLPEVVQLAQRLNAAVYWLTYSTTLAQYTDRRVTTIGDVEDPKLKGLDKKRDATIVPGDPPPTNLLAPFTELAHLTRPVLSDLFPRLTGGDAHNFLTKGALESALHAIGEEIHRQYILTFSPAPGAAGEFHTIRIAVKDRPDLKVKTREGYWSIQ